MSDAAPATPDPPLLSPPVKSQSPTDSATTGAASSVPTDSSWPASSPPEETPLAPPPEGTTPPAPATLTHLREALARKAITSRLYGYLARQADAEGRRDLARLFRELADGETLHVYGLIEYLRPHGDPITGLEITHWDGYLTAAVTASRHESQTLFPSMAAAARAEGQSPIADWFDSLARAEANHADRLQRYRDSLTPR